MAHCRALHALHCEATQSHSVLQVGTLKLSRENEEVGMAFRSTKERVSKDIRVFSACSKEVVGREDAPHPIPLKKVKI